MSKEKLKTKVIELIGKGWDNAKIMKKFPEVSRQQIAAYRAHITMGTYS